MICLFFLFVAGPRVRGDRGAIQRCAEADGFAVTSDLAGAQRCLQGCHTTVLLRQVLPTALPGTRSTYTRLDHLDKRGRAAGAFRATAAGGGGGHEPSRPGPAAAVRDPNGHRLQRGSRLQ